MSIVITIKYSLFKTYNIETRDIFVSNDIRTKRLDVEDKLNDHALKRAEQLRNEIASIEDLVRSD